VAAGFLGKWFGGLRKAPPSVEEARADLDRLAAQRPSFRAPLLWLRDLLPDLAPDADITAPPLTPDQARAKLAGGVPLLYGENISADDRAFRRRWKRACDVLQALQPDAAAADLADAVRRGRLSPAEMTAAVLAGRPEQVYEQAAGLGLGADLAATLLRYTLFPTFTALAAALEPLRQGAAWGQGSCPTCGGRPLLAEFRGLDQSRWLRCGLCASGWEAARQWCPFCGNRDHETLHYLHREGEELRCRAALCDACRGYVKTLQTLTPPPPLALLVADAATLHLDLAAAERGYSHS
jgi:FdhE protein